MSPTVDVDVVGGTYRERILEPVENRLLGSGIRAAATVKALGGTAVQLHTAVDTASLDELQAVAHGFEIAERHVLRASPISFIYSTPIDIPTQSQTDTDDSSVLRVDADRVIAFGMVEGSWAIEAKQAVVDPQHARLDSCGLLESHIGRLALILNSTEVARLMGENDQPSARRLMDEFGAEVLIVKRGALGAWVFHGSEVVTIFAYHTPKVSPVGSGDAFSAGFAHAWMVQDKAPLESARFASKVAAAQSLYDTPAIEPAYVKSIGDEEVVGDPGCVYLASPFFAPGERWLLNRARAGLRSLGSDVFSPLHEIGMGGDEVAQLDLRGLDESQGVLALLDGSDPGTIFEVGWARKKGIPVVAYSSQPNSARWTMLRGTGCTVTDDFSTSIYHAAWAAMRPMENGNA